MADATLPENSRPLPTQEPVESHSIALGRPGRLFFAALVLWSLFDGLAIGGNGDFHFEQVVKTPSDSLSHLQ